MNKQGKLIIFSAPSGSGKTTVVRHLLEKYPDLEFSISACNRPKRPAEEDGRDYYFISDKDFREKIKNDEFVEYEEVYPGRYYGTLRSELERIWAKGNHVVFDVDVVGGLNLKKEFGSNALALFIRAPSVKELEKRLRARSSDDQKSIRERVDKATEEMKFAPRFDHIIINDDLERAIEQAEVLIRDFVSD